MYKNNKEIEFTLEYACKEGMWVFFFLLRGGLIDWLIDCRNGCKISTR